MDSRIDILKGIHPTKFIQRELKNKNISLDALATATSIPYEIIDSITAGAHILTIEDASKIEVELGLETGFLITLQQYYGIVQVENERLACLYPTPPRIRKSLFWDADFDRINWGKYKETVIQRVLERGSEEEIEEIKKLRNITIYQQNKK